MGYKNPTPSIDFDEKTEKGEREENEYTKNPSVYFAFLDVLGFKQAFNENHQQYLQQDKYEFAEKFKDVFIYYFDLMSSANFMSSRGALCYAGQTSDCLYFYTDREDFLIEFLKIFSHLNVYAMTKDVFFRGGVAKGKLYYKALHQFYGDSVIYAYLLESEISKNPIVVIDEKTYEAVNKFRDSEKLICHANNRHYLYPFAFLDNEFDLDVNPLIIREINNEKILEMIEMNKSKYEYDSRVFDKYCFLYDKFPMNKKVQKAIG